MSYEDEEEGLGLSFFFLDDASDGSSAAPSVVVLFGFFTVSSSSRSLVAPQDFLCPFFQCCFWNCDWVGSESIESLCVVDQSCIPALPNIRKDGIHLRPRLKLLVIHGSGGQFP